MSAESSAPAVSFLCSAYRTESTVAQTIESVLAQTRDDWELIVVDNGESDPLAAVVERFTSDPRIRLVRQPNQMAWGGVNAAGRAATGRYVAVVHSDDLVAPTFMERLVPRIDREPGLGAIACDAAYLTPWGVRRGTYRGPVPRRYRHQAPVSLLEMIEGWVPYYTGLVRREAWDEVGGFRSDARTVEDMALWIDLIEAGHPIKVVDEVLALYREDDNSDSRGALGYELMTESWEQVMGAAVEKGGTQRERSALAAAVVRTRHRASVVRGRRLLLEGDVAGSAAAVRDALDLHPDVRTRAVLWAIGASPTAVRLGYRLKRWWHRRYVRATARPL